MRIFTSQKNRKQIVSLIVDFFLEELTVADPLLCVSFSSTSFHLIPIKTNRWFNIKFDWLCSTTYLEIRCCKNPKISLLTTTSETFSFATSTFSLTVSLTSENETKVYMNIWMDGYMLFFSVTANWQHITTVAGFFFIFSHTTYHLQWISFPPQGAKSDTKMIWINQDVFKSHVFFSHINFEVVHLSKSIQKYKLHIDLLVNIQSTNTRVFEILPKPSMKKFTFSQSSGWKLTTLLFHSSEILFPASSTFSFTVSLISKPSIQFFFKVFLFYVIRMSFENVLII